MSAENDCLLSTVYFSRVAHAHNARILRPVSYVRFSALVADGMHGMFVVISREISRMRAKIRRMWREKALIARFFVTITPRALYAHFRGEKIAEDCRRLQKIAEDCNPKSACSNFAAEKLKIEN